MLEVGPVHSALELSSRRLQFMIILVSDLHLADNHKPTVRLDVFLRDIERRITFAAECGVKAIQLVLLGDIFEILKSKKWLIDRVRPWEKSSPEHQHTVETIFEGIVHNNRLFFDGLNNLTTDCQPSVRVSYVPGNHDRPLKTNMGAIARTRLKNLVPNVDWEYHFDHPFVDPEHRLIAKHGHEWDPLNRYHGNTAAIGDAIVIDLLLNLSVLFIKELGLLETDPNLDFLHELDNVRPQNGKILAEWLSRGLDNLVSAHPEAREVFDNVCNELLKNFTALKVTSQEQGIEFEHFTHAERLVKTFRRATRVLGLLETAELIPSLGNEAETVGEFAVNEFSSFQRFGVPCRYVVSGHTHKPALFPLNASGCQSNGAPLYLNTGTWRRVHCVSSTIKRLGHRNCFATWDEECVITIYSEQEQQAFRLPAYEFSRLSRGLNV